MGKFKSMWTFVLLFILAACNQNEDFNKEDVADQKDRPLVQLTVLEYLSIAYNSENELSNEDATSSTGDISGKSYSTGLFGRPLAITPT